MSNDSKTNERDELLKLHAPLTRGAQEQPEYRDNTESALYGYSEGVEHALDTVWAKGYRKPRTITTVEELATLSRGTVLVSPFWTDAYSYIGGEGSPTKVQNVTTGASASVSESDDFFPATVVHEFAWATK